MADEIVRRRVVVRGRVQGVWFRQSTRDEAVARGASGWVRNLPGGAVEAVFEGPPHVVEAMVAWCRVGPDRATVERIEITPEAPEGLSGFNVTG